MGCYEFAHRSERLRELDTLFDTHVMHDDQRSGTGSRERRGQGEREKKRENWLLGRKEGPVWRVLWCSSRCSPMGVSIWVLQPCFRRTMINVLSKYRHLPTTISKTHHQENSHFISTPLSTYTYFTNWPPRCNSANQPRIPSPLIFTDQPLHLQDRDARLSYYPHRTVVRYPHFCRAPK